MRNMVTESAIESVMKSEEGGCMRECMSGECMCNYERDCRCNRGFAVI